MMRISKYFFALLAMVMGIMAQTVSASAADILTHQERTWLANNPVIRVAPERSYAPFSFVAAAGKLEGLSIEYLHLLEQKLGVQFQFIESNNLDTILNMARQGRVDIVTSLMKTRERSEYLLFTSAYISVPAVIITRKEVAGTLSLDQMETLKIAVGQGYAVTSYLDKNYPRLHLVSADDDTACLKMLSFGEVDAAIVDLASASYVIDTLKITNLRVAGNVGFKYELCFASRQDWPILNRIMDKAIAQVSKTEQESINSRWLSLGQPAPLVSRTVWITTLSLLAVLLMIIAAVILWNRTLKREQETRRESEERLREVLENALDASYKRNLQNNTYDYLSPVFAQVSGYAPDEFLNLPIETVFDLIHPEDLVKVDDAIAESMSLIDGRPYQLEYRFKHKDGQYRWFRDRFIVMRDTQGQPIARIGSISDITERKLAAIELAKRTHQLAAESLRLQTLLETASDAIHILDEDGNVVQFSQSFLQMLGYNEAEAANLQVEDWDASIPKDQLVDTVRALIKNPATFETKHRRKDGTIIDVEINAKGVELESRFYLYASARDITERKLIEKALEGERLTLQQALNEVRTLQGILPICAYCKKIRNDDGYWSQVEKYVSDHTEVRFSHGICPACFEREMKEIKEET